MPIQTAIWKVGTKPEQLIESSLAREKDLEAMIVAAPRLLSDDWMLIGRQLDTGYGGRIDLLAIAPDGSLVLIELKRDRTPREVVAQALDYACWVENLSSENLTSIYAGFAPGHSLSRDFRERYGRTLGIDEETELNRGHQIIIVAAALDESTERIIGYLGKREIAINVLCFQVFSHGPDQLLTRTWLLDPVRTQVSASATTADGTNEPWNGEYYCSFGQGGSRSWADARELGFICGGGGAWYSRTLQQLSSGARVWVKVPDWGFVGVGRVTGSAQPASEFKVETPEGQISVLDAAKGGTYHREFLSDPERCEYFVPVKWLDTVPYDKAVYEIGLFGNQNTVCKPTTPKWRSTVERLKEKFPQYNSDAQ